MTMRVRVLKGCVWEPDGWALSLGAGGQPEVKGEQGNEWALVVG